MYHSFYMQFQNSEKCNATFPANQYPDLVLKNHESAKRQYKNGNHAFSYLDACLVVLTQLTDVGPFIFQRSFL